MADIGAPTHDFFSADLASKGWLPGVSWGIQAAGGNRRTNEYQVSQGGGAPNWSTVQESRTILDDPRGSSGSMMPGATGVRGAIRTPGAGSRYRADGAETYEEGSLRRILGMPGERRSRSIAGNATGGRGRASGAQGMGEGAVANNVGNLYEAGRDNVVGSNYIGGNVGDNAGVNQGTNYGVLGGQNNRVNQLFFRGNVGAAPQAAPGGGKPKAAAASQKPAGPQARANGGAPATAAPTKVSPQARLNGMQAPATQQQAAAKPTPGSPATAQVPTTQQAATTTQQPATAPATTTVTGAAPEQAAPATAKPRAKKSTKTATTGAPAAPATGATTGNATTAATKAATGVAKAAKTRQTSTKSTSKAAAAKAEVTEAPTTSTDPLGLKKTSATKATTGTAKKSTGTTTGRGRKVEEEVTGDEFHGMLAGGMESLDKAIQSRDPNYQPGSILGNKPTGSIDVTSQTSADSERAKQTLSELASPSKSSGETTASMAKTTKMDSMDSTPDYDDEVTTAEIREVRDAADKFNASKTGPTVESSPASPTGMARPTGPRTRSDGSWSVGDPLLDKAYDERMASPQGPAPQGGDTFKKIRGMASRALRRGAR